MKVINWFEIFADRLSAIEEGQKEIRELLVQTTAKSDSNPYGSFQWLCKTCVDVPESTLRIKSSKGEIPGVIKFGKRVMYEKAAVLSWLRSQTKYIVDPSKIEQTADLQVNAQLHRRSQKREVPA